MLQTDNFECAPLLDGYGRGDQLNASCIQPHPDTRRVTTSFIQSLCKASRSNSMREAKGIRLLSLPHGDMGHRCLLVVEG